MSVYHADLRAKTYKIKGERVRFEPTGEVVVHGDIGFEIRTNPLGRSNPLRRSQRAIERVKRPMQSARIIMGFNVHGKPPENIEATRKAVMALVEELRREEVAIAFEDGTATPSQAGGDIGASFLEQRGYWHPVNDPHEDEEGLQIVIFNTIDEDPEEFRNDMEVIAEDLTDAFDQDVVIVEHQLKGVTEETVLIERSKK